MWSNIKSYVVLFLKSIKINKGNKRGEFNMNKSDSKDNYIYIPTNMPIIKNKGMKVIYRRKYLDKAPNSLTYKIKNKLYLYILNLLKTRPINKPVILNRAKAVIIDKRYEYIYTFIANRYDRFEEKYERLANDRSYNNIYKFFCANKWSLGIAMGLFIILYSKNLSTEPEQPITTCNEEKTEFIKKDYIVITEEDDNFTDNIMLSTLTKNNSLNEKYLVYTSKNFNNHFLRPEKQREFEHFVTEYAFYFNLNADDLIDVFKKATKNYSNLDLVIDSTRYDITNPESVAIMYVYFFYRNPEKYLKIDVTEYGYNSKSDFKTSDEIFIIEPNWMHDRVKDDNIIKEDITLRNGLSYSEYVGRMSDLISIPKEYKPYILSVSYEERGQFGSEISVYKNNMGGLRGYDLNYIKYPSPEAGIIAFVANIKNYEFNFNITSLLEFGQTYDGDEYVNQWVQNVSDNYKMICNNMDKYFLTDEEEYMYIVNATNYIYNENGEYEAISQNWETPKTLEYKNSDDNQ